MKKQITVYLLMMLFFLMVAGQAHALLIIAPEDAIAWGDANNVPDIFDEWSAISSDTELYKADVGESDSGLFASSYSTFYTDTLGGTTASTDPGYATITYETGDWINSDPMYLLVKDGRNTPAWYGFNLIDLGWDGQETISIEDFWPGTGAISHVSIHGDSAPVPEPATILLFGAGLVGLAGARLRRKNV